LRKKLIDYCNLIVSWRNKLSYLKTIWNWSVLELRQRRETMRASGRKANRILGRAPTSVEAQGDRRRMFTNAEKE